MVPADVLGLLAATTDLVILPLVGSVRSNRAWIEKNLVAQPPAAAAGAHAEGARPTGTPGEWGSLFDQADAAVLLDLQVPPSDGDADGGAFGEVLGQTLDALLDDPTLKVEKTEKVEKKPKR